MDKVHPKQTDPEDMDQIVLFGSWPPNPPSWNCASVAIQFAVEEIVAGALEAERHSCRCLLTVVRLRLRSASGERRALA